MKARRISITITLVLFAFLSAVNFPSQAEAAYKIGVILSTTGKYASLGQHEKDAILLLVDKINKSGGIKGNRLELVIEDDESNPTKASSLAKKFITEDKVVAMIGSSGDQCSHAIALECEKREIPLLYVSPNPSIMKDKKWVFSVLPSTPNQLRKTVKIIKEHFKKSKVGVLYDSNEYGTQLKNFLVKFGEENKDIEVVTSESYQKGDIDLKPQLIKIRNKGAGLLYIAGSVPTPAIAVRNFRDLEMNIPILCAGGVTNAAFIKLGGKAVEGVYLVTMLEYGDPPPRQKGFFVAIKEKYNTVPSQMHALGWGSTEVLSHAMKVAGNDPKAIRDALENIKGFMGIFGEYNLSPTDHNGLTDASFSLVQIKNATWQVVR